MKPISITATILLAFCMSCSTTNPIPEPDSSHPASSSATVPVLPGPSDLLATHDPLPLLSTQQAPEPLTPHDHDAMQDEPSSTEHNHAAMTTDPAPTASEPSTHDHRAHEPVVDEPAAPPADAHDAHQAHDAEPEQVIYACPMHPDQRSNEPASCPICGMKLEPVEVKP